LRKFITHSYEECFDRKHAILWRLPSITPTPSYERFWPAAKELIKWSLRREVDEEEPSIPNVIRIYRNALERYGFKDLSNTLEED
jgi:hypothetical protein